MHKTLLTTFALAAAMSAAQAGPLDPDCTPEKAAKSTAAKATVGVGGRCSPAEAASDSAKRAAGIEDKGPLDKGKKDNDGVAGAAAGAAKNIVK